MWLSRGVPLPPRGSPQDLVLRELYSRERAERASEMTLVVRLLGAVAGVDSKKLDAALDKYIDQLTHRAYRERATPVEDRAERERIAKVERLHSWVR